MKKKARRSIGFAYAMWLAGAVTGLFGLHRFYLQRKKSGSIMVGIVALGVALWAYGMFQIFAPVLEQASALLASGGDFAPSPSSSPSPAAAVAEKAAAFLQGGDIAGALGAFVGVMADAPYAREGLILLAAASAWMVVDLLLIPFLARR